MQDFENTSKEPEDVSQEKKGLSRRKFLQILGAAGAGAGVAGCADKATQNIFPYVKGEREQIPGVAVWYSSTCAECSAGCGIIVRTREGRAVKVEGNPANPINRGGVCALGQSALQNLYDPDRVRQPLARINGKLEPISWDEALNAVSGLLKDSTKTKAYLGGETTGTLDQLISSWCDSNNIQRVTFDPASQSALAQACALAYGVDGIPKYRIDKAEVLLNFGADFLETWISPVEYARDWAIARKAKKPLRFVHVEPRLSLTGANADLWLSCKPGSEAFLAAAILKLLLAAGKGENLSDDVRANMREVLRSIDLEQIESKSGVSKDKLLLVVNNLSEAKSTLVLAGGTDRSLLVLTCFINMVLGNVGETVDLGLARPVQSSLQATLRLVKDLNARKYKVLFVSGCNPEFNLPESVGFKYALREKKAKDTAVTLVSFSSHLDETAALADFILPINTNLETWGDARPMPGVYALRQPSMSPVFDTMELGDILLTSASRAGKSISDAKDFHNYLRDEWKKVYQVAGAQTDFESFWNKCVERGGYFEEGASKAVKVKVSTQAYKLKLQAESREYTGNEVSVLPFPSVKSFDGRAANRPWLQELPDPITQIVWDSWVELHPSTAKKLSVEQGDLVILRNDDGEIHAPAYISNFVHPGIVAVPLGHGHSSYGRYAGTSKDAKVVNLISVAALEALDMLPLRGVKAQLIRSLTPTKLVHSQGSDSQLGRGLAQSVLVSAAASEHASAHGQEGHEHAAGHEEKQMYEQRKSPLYRWGMVVDLDACTGCSACVVACYAENNIPVVGKKIFSQGREMSWLRIERYLNKSRTEDVPEESHEELTVSFLPMMCQQCENAPCEPVCPVYATYHNEEGLNAMIYNRCVGTRYCSNNCPYKVRRFNWFDYELPDPANWQLNPDVTKRTMGVMEKCTFCVQRINEGKDRAKDLGREVEDGEIRPACVQSCPTQALTFGDLNNPRSRVRELGKTAGAYKVLDHHINTQPSVTYLKRMRYKL